MEHGPQETNDVLDALGWEQPTNPPETIDIPLTSGYVDLLRECREDLSLAMADRLPDPGEPVSTTTLVAITEARDAALVLDRLITTFEHRDTEPF